MHKSSVENFFEHILQRQTAHGPERAFRFKAVKASDGSLYPAEYPSDFNHASRSRRKVKRTSRRSVPDSEPADSEPADSEPADTEPADPAMADPDQSSKKSRSTKSKGRRKDSGRRSKVQPAPDTDTEPADPAMADPDQSSKKSRSAKSKGKRKHSGRRSTVQPASDTDPMMTYVRVNQMTMNEICTTVGVTQPQAINGPNDGDPEYLIPQDIYMRYMAFAQEGPLAIDKPNDTPFALDPSLMEENYCTPRPRPKPRPLFRKNRAEDAGSSAAGGGTAEGGAASAAGGTAEGGTASAAGGTAEGGLAAGGLAEGGTASAEGGTTEGGLAEGG
jgi:hypothetical protein